MHSPLSSNDSALSPVLSEAEKDASFETDGSSDEGGKGRKKKWRRSKDKGSTDTPLAGDKEVSPAVSAKRLVSLGAKIKEIQPRRDDKKRALLLKFFHDLVERITESVRQQRSLCRWKAAGLAARMYVSFVSSTRCSVPPSSGR